MPKKTTKKSSGRGMAYTPTEKCFLVLNAGVVLAVCVKIPYAIRRVLVSEKRNPRFPPHVERELKMKFLSFLGCLDPD
eukprot:5074194-Ditylum_brightwellii.AAC.1